MHDQLNDAFAFHELISDFNSLFFEVVADGATMATIFFGKIVGRGAGVILYDYFSYFSLSQSLLVLVKLLNFNFPLIIDCF